MLILLGDFNINLLNSGNDENISSFLDTLGNHLILPNITLPTRVTQNSKTLIDNIYSSPVKFNKISGNLISGIPQFLLLDKHLSLSTPEKVVRDWKNFDRTNFTMDFISSDWDQLLDLDNKNPDNSFNSFITTLEGLLDAYAPKIKLTKKQIKSNLKPWITQGIKKSIFIRDKILKQYINCKDVDLKEYLHERYKTYRNSIVNLIRNSKKIYFTNYFQTNSKNSKKIWQGINDYLHRKKNKGTENITLNLDGKNITEPKNVANINNFFTSIADNSEKRSPKPLITINNT